MLWIIIQARSGSTRLPNKILAPLGGSTVLKCVYDICKRVVEQVIIAIPDGDPCRNYMKSSGMLFYEGSEEDVLDRYYRCAEAADAELITRITSDCPLLPVSTLSIMVTMAMRENYDFLTNAPCVDGHDIEIMSAACLKWLHTTATDPKDREHVTTYAKSHWEKMRQMGFKIGRYRDPFLIEWFPKISIDTADDLERVRGIYKKLGEQ